MRWKIIIVNAGIVAIVAVLSFVLLSTSLSGTLQDPVARKADVERAIRSANAQLELDGLRMERWLAEQANTEDLRVIFSVGTTDARAESATKQANKIHDAAKAEPGFQQMAPSLVLLVNEAGVGLGRNGTNLMRGDDMGAIYPSLKESLKTGRTMSDVWLNKGRGEQMLASYAPVRGENDEIVGAIVVGTPLNDERLTNTSRLTSGVALVMGVKAEGAFEVIARSDQVGAAQSALQAQPVVAAAEGTLTSGNMAVVSGASDQYLAGAAPLSGYGGGSHAALIAAVPSSLVPSIGGLLWPVFAGRRPRDLDGARGRFRSRQLHLAARRGDGGGAPADHQRSDGSSVSDRAPGPRRPDYSDQLLAKCANGSTRNGRGRTDVHRARPAVPRRIARFSKMVTWGFSIF